MQSDLLSRAVVVSFAAELYIIYIYYIYNIAAIPVRQGVSSTTRLLLCRIFSPLYIILSIKLFFSLSLSLFSLSLSLSLSLPPSLPPPRVGGRAGTQEPTTRTGLSGAESPRRGAGKKGARRVEVPLKLFSFHSTFRRFRRFRTPFLAERRERKATANGRVFRRRRGGF